MRILALDCGTSTGWAVIRPGMEKPESGSERFDIQRGESPGMRFIRFRSFLDDLRSFQPELYVFEQAHHRGGYATQLCVGMTTRVIEEAARHKAQHVAVHSGTLKKWATGKGNSDKQAMIAAATQRWGFVPWNDDEADALLLLAYGMEKYGSLIKSQAGHNLRFQEVSDV